MATAQSSIFIDGKKIDPYQITLEQRFDWHHTFEIAVASEKVEGKNCITIDNSIEFVGKLIEINIENKDNELKFKGIVTSVQLDRTYAGDSLIVFSGFSPTYLLEDGQGTKSYEEKTLKKITDSILSEYPSNVINPVVDPDYTKSIPYIVRYKESHYQYLCRLAATYGEWFYYDGQTTIFGKLPNPDSIEMTLGRDLNSFGYGVQVKPSKFKYQYYKYMENRVLENSTADYQPSWLDNYGKKALTAADEIFTTEPLTPTWLEAENDSHIKHLAQSRKSSMLSDTTYFKGESQNPGVKVGGRITANAINRVGGQNVSSVIGHFRIISVTHRLEANRNYSNHFQAVPVTVTAPPVNKNVSRPEAESQVAVVIDNHDPEGLGRIRAQFNWQSGAEMTPWIRVLTSSAAGGRGMYFIPEVGDEVSIDFHLRNPSRPYAAGTLFNGKARPLWGKLANIFKVLRTRSGNQIKLNDSCTGGITISDAAGNKIHLDTKNKSISITAPEKITLKAKDIDILADSSINFKSSTCEDGQCGPGIINMEAKEEIKINSQASDISIEAKAKNINLDTKENLNVKAQETIEMKSNKTCIDGKCRIDIKSEKTDLRGGILKLRAKRNAILRGENVKIN